MRVRLLPVGELTGHASTVIIAFDRAGRLVLCRHRDRSTWETPGGHIETAESAMEAAERELFEETGIVPRDLTAVADYEVDGAAGRLFTAEVRTRSALPAFEIAETIDCDELPENLTYPEITPILLSAVTEWRSRHRTSNLNASNTADRYVAGGAP